MRKLLFILLLTILTCTLYSQWFYPGEVKVEFQNDTLRVVNVEEPWSDDPNLQIDSIRFQYIFQGLINPSYVYSDSSSGEFHITACKVKVVRVAYFYFSGVTITVSTDAVLGDQSGLVFTGYASTLTSKRVLLHLEGNFDYAEVSFAHIVYGNVYSWYISYMMYWPTGKLFPGTYIVDIPYRIKGPNVATIKIFKGGCVQSVTKYFYL